MSRSSRTRTLQPFASTVTTESSCDGRDLTSASSCDGSDLIVSDLRSGSGSDLLQACAEEADVRLGDEVRGLLVMAME